MGSLENKELKKTPLYEEHIKLGARMVPFAGWNMPVQYSNVIEEHLATRNKVGLFDISHMGEFIVNGKNSLEWLQKMVTNDLSRLNIKQACYNCLCYDNGTIVDDVFVYKLSEDEFFIVVNACNIEKDFKWLEDHKEGGIKLKNISKGVAKIDVQGPKAEETIKKLTDYDLNNIKRFFCDYIKLKSIDDKILASRTGYTGEDGFELYINPKFASKLWNDLLDAGEEFGIKPCGLGARDTLRIESCYSLYGHELNDKITPIEAGIGFAVKLNKDFIGKNILENQKNIGTENKLICFEMTEKAVPRENYKIINNNEEIGFVSSGTFSPLFKKGIGMGFVKEGSSEAGSDISISIRGKEYKAVIVKRPFYKYKGGE